MGVVKAGGGSVGADVDVLIIDGPESTKGNSPLVRSGIWDKSRVGRLLPEDLLLLGVVVVVRGLGLLVDFLVLGVLVVFIVGFLAIGLAVVVVVDVVVVVVDIV